MYLVWDERLYALAVAKVLRPEKQHDERARRRFAAEADVLARLAHPAIVRSFGVVRSGPFPHVLLEHVDAPTLRHLVRRHGPLPLEQLLPLGVQVASALHYLAGEGLVHLDVKPSNVLMAQQARLIDLGTARSFAEAAELRRPVGTAAYRSPEQHEPLESPGAVGPAADVWGLGATLTFAATGEPPGDEPDVPAELDELLALMLAHDPAERPTAAEAADALADLMR